ncbi:MAG: ATP-grasp domain-containing protein [Bacteroidota bacterium]
MNKKLLGWILYKDSADLLKPEAYEIHKLVEVAGKHDIDIKVLSPEQIDIIVTREDRKSILVCDVPTALPDFILPRMGAGTTYFALAVIRHLERLGVYSINNSQSIDTVKDKLYTLQILAESNLPIPKTILLKFPVDSDIVIKHLKFPVIVKTLSGSQGSGVFLSTDKNSFEDLTQLINTTNKTANIILQEFIETSKGRDLRVLTIGGRVVSAMMRSANDGRFKANYSIGGNVEKFEITPELEWIVLEISRILNLDIAGIDLLFDKQGFKICEVNSSPGFRGMEKCCEIDVADEIFKFIKIRLGLFG